MDPLADQWSTRDLPVLLKLAEYRNLDGRQILPRIHEALGGLAEDEMIESIDALEDGGYLEAHWQRMMSGRVLMGVKLRERGRRALGIWPSAEGVDALVDALRQAEDVVDDPEEKTLIRRAAGAVGSVSRDVMVDVMAAVIARQSGIG